jgi:ADP-ribosylglycohydrolase
MTNTQILNNLFAEEKIKIQRGKIFNRKPSRGKLSEDFDHIEGMMLGLAIGDSLGNRSEAMNPQRRFQHHGEIRDYLPNPYAEFDGVGLPSDDTQLAFWTLEQILEDGEFIPENLARRFCRERIFGLGSSVREFLYNFKSGRKWFESGPQSAGNGALMRIAPILIPHLKTADETLWVDTALCAMITHNDSASIASCVAFVDLLWQVLDMDETPSPEWWLETFVETVKDLETENSYRTRGGEFADYQGNLADFVEEKVSRAFQKNLSAVDACNSWYSGAYLLETVPSVIYILMKHGDNFEEAVIRAVNDTRDNDTIGAIVGAAVGALHGKSKIPVRWQQNLLGRTSENDDGKVFEILQRAKLY